MDDDNDNEDDNKRADKARGGGSPYLVPKEAAKYLRIRPQTLAKMRMQKRGPRYRKDGRVIRYHIRALDAWLTEKPQ